MMDKSTDFPSASAPVAPSETSSAEAPAVRGELPWNGELEMTTPEATQAGKASWAQRMTGSTALMVTAIDIALIALFTVLSHEHLFFTVSNFQNLAISAAEIIALALGEVYLLGAGEFDISLGALLVLSSVVGAKVMQSLEGTATATGSYPHPGLAIFAGVLAALAAGTIAGLINGLVVTRLRVNSLLATLAMLGAATGVAELLSGGGDIGGVPPQLQTDFGASQPAGIPLPTILVALLVIVGWFILTKLRFGLHTLAIGSSREAAHRGGLKVQRHIIFLFAGAGLMAGVAGLIDLSRFATTNIGGHQNDALSAIAGVVIGGTALFGGRASVAGAVAGTMFSVILQVGLVILNVSPYYQLIATGAILILAVSLDERRRAGHVINFRR